MVPHAVQLDTLVVVDVQVLLLCGREHLVIMEEFDVENSLFSLKLAK